MQDPMNSTPIYQAATALQFQSGSTLFLFQHTQHADAQLLLQKFAFEDQSNLLILAEMPNADTDLDQYLQRIQQRMQHATTGWHAVVYGDEAFIWRVMQTLLATGLMQDEISLISSTGPRQVYCVHCGHQQLYSQQDYCDCEQCGVHLLVRSHFSRRLGAYMGVCADADYPHGDAA
ncbi:dimethylamine monooxygenase subunit DmmA family protein [Acinetobacter colistiniresistens]|uniref:Dimethylamine monooxygenase subunit DmmA-like C-terminal domain-containing protein n=1 Tax=Acinetobacter colistiniresistens TaxID=280145 RepID=A0A558F2F5_9GAMM|nr:dimethylamine monooxygenase subunit DmmA family protein [Acinetobacter colistiniresistens]TVT79784.1 hypothetical protein FPV60_13830 [Acinetobacter colistiniresistens]